MPLKPQLNPRRRPSTPFTYIDLFAGCGGLSLGLGNAGWEGVLAVEKNPMAFATFEHNFLSVTSHFPGWPEWFPRKPCGIGKFTKKYAQELASLRGKVNLVAGGPPCQGFSFAGMRQKADHRNSLYKSYLRVVQIVRPAAVLLENVQGITFEFGRTSRRHHPVGRKAVAYSEKIKQGLAKIGYRVLSADVMAARFGVPQTRARFIAVGFDERLFTNTQAIDFFEILKGERPSFLRSKGLPTKGETSCREALQDLERTDATVVPCKDSPRFLNGCFGKALTPFQRLMRGSVPNGAYADSHRFVNHTPEIQRRFAKIQETCRRGIRLTAAERKRFKTKKACVVPLNPHSPALTLTTLPDDMLHYSEPRILTVREYARLQSFPDSFEFKSRYTTGGDRRRRECPRYTQVGNAVPPLLAQCLGRALARALRQLKSSGKQSAMASPVRAA